MTLTKEKIESYVWWEKYRPRTVKDIFLQPTTQKKIEKYLEDKALPHLIFFGSPGTGKCLGHDEDIEIYVDKKTYDKYFADNPA